MRMSINTGAKKGIKDKITEKELLGLRRIKAIINIGTIKDKETGMRSCEASFSEFTMEPTAA